MILAPEPVYGDGNKARPLALVGQVILAADEDGAVRGSELREAAHLLLQSLVEVAHRHVQRLG